MILTVTPNPAIDVTIAVDRVRTGHTHVVDPAARRAGGKGLNVARVAAQTGAEAVATGLLGDTDAPWFAADLSGIRLRASLCQGPTRSSFAVSETEPGRVTLFNERGHPRSAAEWDGLIQIVAEEAARSACVVVSGSLPPDPPGDAIARVIAAAGNVPVIADLVGEALWEAIDAGAQIVKPNKEELARTVGHADVLAGARTLIERGATLVLVSLGEDGILAVPATGPARSARLSSPLRGNATGAGDAAVAAVATALDAGADPATDLDRILCRAVGWSAAAVLAPLAGALHSSHAELVERVHLATV